MASDLIDRLLATPPSFITRVQATIEAVELGNKRFSWKMNPMGKFLDFGNKFGKNVETHGFSPCYSFIICIFSPPLRKNKDILCYNTRLSIMTNILYLQMFPDEE